jgi:hypothetical protein
MALSEISPAMTVTMAMTMAKRGRPTKLDASVTARLSAATVPTGTGDWPRVGGVRRKAASRTATDQRAARGNTADKLTALSRMPLRLPLWPAAAHGIAGFDVALRQFRAR